MTVINMPVEDLGTYAELDTNEDFISNVAGPFQRAHYMSRPKTVRLKLPDENDDWWHGRDRLNPKMSLGLRAIHQAFDTHFPLTLSPEAFWYMIVYEVAEHIKQNAGDYGSMFNGDPDSKQLIVVQDDNLQYDGPSDWGRTIDMFKSPLVNIIGGETVDMFLPHFSTSTDESDTALLVAFMDTVSAYFEYGVRTMCGIPQITLEAEADDWRTLLARTEDLARTFPALKGYFDDLVPVVATIVQSATTGPKYEEFWASIYKLNGGSGGPYVNGWITAFMAHVNTPTGMVPREQFGWKRMNQRSFGGFEDNQLPTHVSSVPFNWNYMGRDIDMKFIAGFIGTELVDDRSIAPRLGFGVVEL